MVKTVDTNGTNNTTNVGSVSATCPDPMSPANGRVTVGEGDTVVDVGCRSPLPAVSIESMKLWLLESR